MSHADGSYAKLMAQLHKDDVLILDDFGLTSINAAQRHDLFNLIEDRYQLKATIITKSDFVGNVMSLCIEKRGQITNQTYLTTERVELTFDMPLAEIVFDMLESVLENFFRVTEISVNLNTYACACARMGARAHARERIVVVSF